jgi:hypothetical protein
VYVTSALSFLGKSSVAATFLLFKLFFFLVSLLNLFLLDRACRNTAVTFLYAWNPLTIIEGAGHGHVSIFLVCFLLAAYAAYHRGLFRATAGLAVWVFLLLAAMIKFTAALFLPFAGVSCLLSRYGRERWRSLVVLAAAAVAIPLLLYLPLWSGGEIFDAVHRASRLFNYNALPFIFLTAVFSAAGSGDPLALALKVVRWLFLASYLGLGVYFLREVVQRRSPSLFRYLFAVQGALIFWSSYIMPWYFYELFVLSLLAGSEGTVAQLRGRTLASVPLILTLLGIVFYAVQH